MKIYGHEEGHELTIDDFYLNSESEESTKASIFTNQTVNKVFGVVNTSSRKSSKNTSSVKSRRLILRLRFRGTVLSTVIEWI
jgi:hypothetical protein